MSRLRRRNGGDLDDFDAYQDDIDIDFLADATGEDKHKARRDRAARHKAAWQRVDERKEIRLLRKQLEDWEDWDANWPDEGRALGAPGTH